MKFKQTESDQGTGGERENRYDILPPGQSQAATLEPAKTVTAAVVPSPASLVNDP